MRSYLGFTSYIFRISFFIVFQLYTWQELGFSQWITHTFLTYIATNLLPEYKHICSLKVFSLIGFGTMMKLIWLSFVLFLFCLSFVTVHDTYDLVV
jgi:hypothetical protein